MRVRKGAPGAVNNTLAEGGGAGGGGAAIKVTITRVVKLSRLSLAVSTETASSVTIRAGTLHSPRIRRGA